MSKSVFKAGQNLENYRMEKRDMLDVILARLLETFEPVKKTHLLYRMRINHIQLTRYISLLLKLEMIEETSEPQGRYVITDKGRTLVELFGKTTANISKHYTLIPKIL